jgi:hypothetical protein
MKGIIIFLTITLVVPVVSAWAASQEDVAKAIELMKLKGDVTEYANGSFQCSYVVKGKRYRAFYTYDNSGGQLSFWIGADGTEKQEFQEHVSGSKGNVEAGTDCDGGSLFDNGIGWKYKKYWQSVYDKVIIDTIDYFQGNSS